MDKRLSFRGGGRTLSSEAILTSPKQQELGDILEGTLSPDRNVGLGGEKNKPQSEISVVQNGINREEDVNIQIDQEPVKFDDCDSDFSEDDSTREEEKKTGAVLNFFLSRKFLVLLFVMGILLIAIGVIAFVVLGDISRSVGRSLVFVGIVLVSGLIGEVIVYFTIFLVNLFLKLSPSDETRYKLTVAAYYLFGMSTSLARFWWAVLCAIGIAIVKPPDGENSAWDTAYFFLIRIFVILALLCLARAAATGCRSYLSQDFGTRSYQEKVKESLSNQNLLGVLTGSFDPVFEAIFDLVSGDLANGQLHPEDWQRMIRYINTHHVNGNLPGGGKHQPTKPGADDGLGDVAKPVSGRLFRKWFGLVEARRALLRAQHQAELERQEHQLFSSQPNGTVPGVAKRSGSDSDLLKAANAPSSQDESDSLQDKRANGSLKDHVTSRTVGQGEKPQRGDLASLFRRKTNKSDKLLASKSPSIVSSSSRVDRKKIFKAEFMEIMDQLYGRDLDAAQFWENILDQKQSGYLSATRFRKIVENMFRERFKLSLTLQDSQVVMKSIDHALMSIFVVLVALIGVGLFSSSSLQILASLATAVLAWSFVFGGAVATAFDNIIFLFGVHPYDVGDKISIGTDRFEVLRIRLLTTDFLRADGAFLRIENKLLSSKGLLYNYSTSEHHGNGFSVHVPVADVSPRMVELIKKDLDVFIKSRPNAFEGFTFTARELIHPLERGCDISLASALYATHVRFFLWVSFAFPNEFLGTTYREQSELLVEFCAILVRHGVCKSFYIYDEKGVPVEQRTVGNASPSASASKSLKTD